MAEEGGKKGWIVLLIILVVGGYFGWPHLQWFRYGLEVRKAEREDLGRFPEPDTLIKTYPAKVKTIGKQFGFETVEVHIELHLRQIGPVKQYIVRSTVTSDGHEFQHEKRSERVYTTEETDYLQENGVKYLETNTND